MTKDKDEKAVIRARMARTGESYAAARAQLSRDDATPMDTPARRHSFNMSAAAGAAWTEANRTGCTAWDLIVALRMGSGIAALVLEQLGLPVPRGDRADVPPPEANPLNKVIGQVLRLVQAEGGVFDSGMLLRGAVLNLEVAEVPAPWRKHAQVLQQADLVLLCTDAALRLGPEEVKAAGDGQREGGGMFERFTDRARQVIVSAQEESRGFGHDWIGTEHVLLGLLCGAGVGAKVLERRGVELESTRTRVLEIVGPGGDPPTGHIPFTPHAKKVLEMSLRAALDLEHDYIGTEHLLLGLIREGEGVAALLLGASGLTEEIVRTDALEILRSAKQTDDEGGG